MCIRDRYQRRVHGSENETKDSVRGSYQKESQVDLRPTEDYIPAAKVPEPTPPAKEPQRVPVAKEPEPREEVIEYVVKEDLTFERKVPAKEEERFSKPNLRGKRQEKPPESGIKEELEIEEEPKPVPKVSDRLKEKEELRLEEPKTTGRTRLSLEPKEEEKPIVAQKKEEVSVEVKKGDDFDFNFDSGPSRRRAAPPKNDAPLFIREEKPVEAPANQGVPRRTCLLYTSPSPRDRQKSRMPSSA
eukprot:TRINITY_DN12033_c0_g2_i2.p1 TRINITY_DN12033_c0_g2~~TRINITY_DN12033_c0_g2_i2.p1  ORF type:complete len:244 (-),score=95.46 TRINITY_DN12033_c0_g2_i2:10-741(-)